MLILSKAEDQAETASQGGLMGKLGYVSHGQPSNAES
ncbi:hypothetical protein VD0002_g730 [Verticillium dahliae]|uniref:Uncharacterized protein n=1 Tax=Verticillium dahliae TaxID=27337 RepID=A0AA44WN06_VERDA|nr:hypothetical protein BJF96_g2604 [Verticillium dahliae]PNH55006.1 hypothetical protein VD0003_g2560 [Verticillium dahliae]PNH69735.1 hypothetical protein VD0002_g730 [Verticillium dahliae]